LKKIVISSNSSWNIINFRLGLATYLKNLGYEIIILAPRDEYSSQIELSGLEYIELPISARSLNAVSDTITFFTYFKILAHLKPDYYLGFTIKPNIWGGIAARILKINRILNIAGLGKAFEKEGLLNILVKFLYTLSLSGAKKIFFQNHDDLKHFELIGLIKNLDAEVLAGSGVDLKKFHFSHTTKESGKFNFLFMGRLLYSKGVKDLIEASHLLNKKFKNFHVYIYGIIQNSNDPDAISIEYLSSLEQYSYITFEGSTDHPNLQIMKSHCVVLPSYYNEGTPKILLESCAMGKPIITTDWKGCRDVVETSKNGYLCDIKSPESLMMQMAKMLKLSEQNFQNLSKNSRVIAEKRYNQDRIFNTYKKALQY